MDVREARSRLERARSWRRNCENHVQRCVDEYYKASRAGLTYEWHKKMLARHGDDYKQKCCDDLKHAKAELKDAEAAEGKAEAAYIQAGGIDADFV